MKSMKARETTLIITWKSEGGKPSERLKVKMKEEILRKRKIVYLTQI